jgi:hypothetical protein
MDKAAVIKGLRKETADKEQFSESLTQMTSTRMRMLSSNLLSQTFGILKEEPLHYIVCPAMMPTAFGSVTKKNGCISSHLLEGGAFQPGQDNNRTVYRKLKAFLIDSPGWAWIEPHDIAENRRNAYLLAWIAHYKREGELSKRTALAKVKLENLHYKNE